MRSLPLLCLLIVLSGSAHAQLPAIPSSEKARVIVLTDVANEPDDEQSFIRLLLYSNELDIECIAATTSVWLQGSIHPEKLHERVNAYRQVYPNLCLHAEGYPKPEELEAMITRGRVAFGMKGVGDGQGTEASKAILDVLRKDSDRPVWVTVWGGSLDLGQALWDLRKESDAEEVAQIVSRLRVYDIAGQDDTGQWICHNFPAVKYIRNVSQFAGISQRHNRSSPPEVTGPNLDCISHAWVGENVRNNHGPLGPLYPLAKYKYEGDTPSFFHLLPCGLSDPEQPHWGSWGGRFTREEVTNPQMQGKYSTWQERYRPYAMHVDVRDTWTYEGKVFRDNQYAPLFRWRDAWQNDFAARMDWCVKPWNEANHQPHPVINGDASRKPIWIQAERGHVVTLDAGASTDPDGDRLTFDWSVYTEPSTMKGVKVERIDTTKALVRLPRDKGGTVHVILSCTDQGVPPLTRYRRIVISVD